MDRPHPDFPEEEQLNPFIGANDDRRRPNHRRPDRAYKFGHADAAYVPPTAPPLPEPPSERPPSPPTTSPYRDTETRLPTLEILRLLQYKRRINCKT